MLDCFYRIFHWGADASSIHPRVPAWLHNLSYLHIRFIKQSRYLFVATLLGLAWFAPLQANNVPVPVGSIYYVQGIVLPDGPIVGFSPEELAAQLVPIVQVGAQRTVNIINSTPWCPSNKCAKLTGPATCSTNSVHQIECPVPGEYTIPSPTNFGSTWTWAVIPPQR